MVTESPGTRPPLFRRPLADARAFKQWAAALRLTERGARATLTDVATLGLADRVEEYFAATTPPTADEVSRAFWRACHGGRQQVAEYLLDRGAEVNWIPPRENLTPLDAAARETPTSSYDAFARGTSKV